MTQITVTEQGGSGRYIDLGTSALANLFNTATGATVIAYVKPGDQTTVNYLFDKCSTAGAGMRVGANSTEQVFGAPYGTSGNTTAPSKNQSAAYTQGVWQHWQMTATGNGSLLSSQIALYIDAGADSSANAVNGSGSINSDASYPLVLLGRGTAHDRNFIGDMAYVAAWNRVLDSTERATVRSDGPLAVSSGLVFCFANGQDYGPSAFAVSSRSTQVAGSTPPNIELGTALASVTADLVASYDIQGTVAADLGASYDIQTTVSADLVASYSIDEGTAAVSSDLVVSYAIQGAVSADLVAAYDIQTPVSADLVAAYDINGSEAIFDPEHGATDLVNSWVTPAGSTPTFNLKSRYIGENNTSGARVYYAKVTGVAGKTPVFKVDRSNFEIVFTQKALWSPSAARGSWQEFDNFSNAGGYFTFSNAAAFVSDTIYIACTWPWLPSYTLPWIQSLEASGLISEPPSSAGNDYVHHTRSATTNGASAGVGDVIPALDLYSARISSGGLAPDGNAKRKMVLTAGAHAAEDAGNYCLKGAVDFLLSADAQAVLVRQWFDITVYPLIAAAGRYGGNGRGDFENANKLYDVNRHWTDSTMETIVAHKAAILADAGSDIPVMIDFHGDHLSAASSDYYAATGAGTRQAAWTAAIQAHRPGLSITTELSPGSYSKWAAESSGAEFSVNPEQIYKSPQTLADFEDFGADHLRAIATLISAGEWGYAPVSAELVASYAIQGTVSADLVADYDIQTTVSADLAASYSIDDAGPGVVSDLVCSYGILGTVAADLVAGYDIRGAGSADLAATYDIRAALSADLVGAYDILGTVVSDLMATWTIAGEPTPPPWRSPVQAIRYVGPVQGTMQ